MVTVSFVLPGNFSKWDCEVGCNHTGGIYKISLGGSKSLWIWVPILYVLSPLNWLFFVQQFPFFAFPKGRDSSDHQVHLKPLQTTRFFFHSSFSGNKKKKTTYSTCLSLFDISPQNAQIWSDLHDSNFPFILLMLVVALINLMHTDSGASDPLSSAGTRWDKSTRRNVKSVRIKPSAAFPFPALNTLEILPWSHIAKEAGVVLISS